MSSLKSFIKAVRAAKTIADERAVIQKESAAIRTSFREDYADTSIRRQNVAKLLYLFTLGERTHWGQVECLKLLASPRFTDKRLGYLGTMLLLDENQEVLTLVTNSLQSDLNQPNQYTVSLALCTLADIASTEMARDLFADVEKLISSTLPDLRKKAALCALRIIRKVPDLEENFIGKAKALLNDRNHGVLICNLALIIDLCTNNPDLIPTFKPAIPLLVNILKSLASSGYMPEYDVSGVADPFLQIKILRLLRVLGANDAQASEKMNDVLAQTASNTDSTKNVGNAVLYETVLTIFGIESDSGLRVLGVNILGKFLTTKDNNTRYVALNTLLHVIDQEPNAVQRHRNIIIDCLQDSDISIKRRALELTYALINDQNVRVLVRELLSFLETADTEFKTILTSQIAIAAEKYAPTKRWHADTLIRMLKIAGSHVKGNVISAFITIVITSEELHLYTAQKLYSALCNDITQEGLTLAGTWLIGEYANTLLQGGSFEHEDVVQEISETKIVELFETIIESPYATQVVKEYVLNALMKLTTRFLTSEDISWIRHIMAKHADAMEVEIQQRVAEYSKLFAHDAVRKGVLEKMPAPEVLTDLSQRYQEEKTKQNGKRPTLPAVGKTQATPVTASEDLLLDLMGDAVPTLPAVPTQATSNDLLSDIFGNGNGSALTSAASPPLPPAKSANQNIMDLFGATAAQVPPTAPAHSLLALSGVTPIGAPAIDPIEAYNQTSLRLTFQPLAQEAAGTAVLQAVFLNTGSTPITGLNLQVAVPKSQRLQLQSLSSATLTPGASATQQLKVSGAPGTSVRLRLRILYTLDGQDLKEQVDFAKLPPGLL